MKKIILLLVVISCFVNGCRENKDVITFYEVPLKCGAAPGIGCGSRIKPLFVAIEQVKEINEAWSNREGTIIAIAWKGQENDSLIQSLFARNYIDAVRIADSTQIQVALSDFRMKGKWLKGMEIDSLSLEEAGVIANDLTQFAFEAKLLSEREKQAVENDIREFFRKELVKIRSLEELSSDTLQERWLNTGYLIYEKHIGKVRADSVATLYQEHLAEMQANFDACCEKKNDGPSMRSEITCPHCGHKETEEMPTEICLLRYTCKNCKAELTPKVGDCCVFCTHGDHQCPSMQE